MKNIYSLLICALAGFSAYAQIPTIATVRGGSLNSIVTATGVVTTGSALGDNIRYFQDATGGLVAYGGSYINVNIGDSITVTGPLVEFGGLMEIGSGVGNPGVITNHGPAVIPVQPTTLPISAINELTEAMLVRLNNVRFVESGSFSGGASTYNLVNVADNSQTLQYRSSSVDFNQPIPAGALTIIGVVGEYGNVHQIIPRLDGETSDYVAPIRDINLVVGGDEKATGSTVNLNGATVLPVVVENQGSGVLTISGISFTGADATLFTVNNTSFTVPAFGSVTVSVTYAPTTNGTKSATMTVSNDDADESSYVIEFLAGGVDGLFTEPTSNPTDLTFTTSSAYRINASFTAVENASRYIVLWKEGSAITEAPVDGVAYLRGDVIGGAKVAYIGSASSFAPRGVTANKTYHFAVFALNGQGSTSNYLTTAPATGSVTSGGSTAGNYYNGISPTSNDFVTNLTGLISNRQVVTYYNFRQTFMQEFDLKDTTLGRSYVECQYSGYKNVFTGTFDWTQQDFSREHVYAHSWMPGQPYNGNSEGRPYNDQHNLLPTKYLEVNSARSNYPFGDVITTNQSFGNAKRGTNHLGQIVYEPQDRVKGDVARAIFYQAVAYNNFNQTSDWGLVDAISFLVPYGQDIYLLMEWHFNDLPDSYEIARHEYVASVQGNRNPFIDNPDWVCNINFRTMNQQECNMSATELSLNNIQLFPNPAKESVTLFGADNQLVGYEVIDMMGRTILNDVTNNNTVAFDVTNFKAGSYLVKVHTDKGTAVKKLIIE